MVGYRFKSNNLLVGPVTVGGKPLVGGGNHEKLRTAKSTSTSGNRTRHLPSTSFECRTALPLVGRKRGKKDERKWKREKKNLENEIKNKLMLGSSKK